MIALASKTLGFPVWGAILAAFAIALAIGAFNGYMVVRTGLPSFIATLASLFALRGLTIYAPISLTARSLEASRP